MKDMHTAILGAQRILLHSAGYGEGPGAVSNSAVARTFAWPRDATPTGIYTLWAIVVIQGATRLACLRVFTVGPFRRGPGEPRDWRTAARRRSSRCIP